MQKQITCKLLPSEAASEQLVTQYIARATGNPLQAITGFRIQKKSIDARGKQAWVQLTLTAFINEPFVPVAFTPVHFTPLPAAAKKVIIVGGGPCGLFAALKLIELGIRPILLERGKNVRDRRRDLALLNKEGIINPESNYCFGEGGAGTYSDGKLYTRSHKRGDINRILNLLHQFGATENILYEAHPHIGTNKLPGIITAMRQQVIESGGQFLFNKKCTDLIITGNTITGVKTADGDQFEAAAVILATGHSARDIFELLAQKQILIEQKPFALGVRVEHPQQLIDSIQYHCPNRGPFLPPAAYSVVQQVQQRGVFSFCMCPGGIIAPASTNPNELVVNGWSPSKRNNPYANSGIVTEITEKDLQAFLQQNKQAARAVPAKQQGSTTLAGMYFQQWVEQTAYTAGGGRFVAPAQRLADFVAGKMSSSLPGCSYLPGTSSASLQEVLPGFVFKSLQDGFKAFGQKMKGYLTNEAIVLATESRTSSPVRVPRHPISLQHPQVSNLYPAGEGAGYAGGIVSAAMDGEKVAAAICHVLAG